MGAGECNLPLSSLHRSTRKKISKDKISTRKTQNFNEFI